MFRKFAKADVLDFKWSNERVSSRAGFDKLADFSFKDYLTADGYIYVRVRAISSRTNKNHDSWPSDELAKSYRTFIGKPIFVDHHNHDPQRARGVVVDAELHVEDQHTSALDPYYSSSDVDPLHLPPTWVELLLEVDAKRFPRLAKAIISGEIDSVSMGADVGYTVCNICSHKAEAPDQFCSHIVTKGAHYDYYGADGKKTSRKSAEHCYKVGFFELSFVFDPADETALTTAPIKTARRTLKESALHASIFDQENEPEDPDELRRRERASWESSEEGYVDDTGRWIESPEGLSEDVQVPGGAPAQAEMGPHSAEVYMWRKEELERAGYSPEQAAELAKRPANEVDLEQARTLPTQGATPELAYSIMARTAKLADNAIPQSEMTKMPETIDTLRQEKPCPICGSDMETGECKLCGYIEPPEGFNNPDLEKAKEVDKQLHDELAQNPGQDQAQDMNAGNQVSPQDVGNSAPTLPTATSSTKWVVVSNTVMGERTAARQPAKRLNTQEKPILPATRKNSDRPLDVKRTQNPTKPTLSKNNEEKMTDTTKTADGATALGEGVQAEKRVDVLGVGAVSGDPLSGISTEDVAKDTGDFEAPHTDTWSNGEGDSLGQQEPVTNEAFESGPIGALASVEKTACDCDEADCPVCSKKKDKKEAAEHGVEAGGASAAGFPDTQPSRISVDDGLAEEVGDRTKTFGSDDFHITEPVTKGEDQDANTLGGPIGERASAFRFATKAMRLAEQEVALGLEKDKWNRVAQLESKDEAYIDAQLETLSKVKTAGLRKQAARAGARTASRMPSLSPKTAAIIEASAVGDADTEDSLFF